MREACWRASLLITLPCRSPLCRGWFMCSTRLPNARVYLWTFFAAWRLAAISRGDASVCTASVPAGEGARDGPALANALDGSRDGPALDEAREAVLPPPMGVSIRK